MKLRRCLHLSVKEKRFKGIQLDKNYQIVDSDSENDEEKGVDPAKVRIVVYLFCFVVS